MGKMYYQSRLCVPESLTEKVIMAHHQLMGHCGVKKLKKEMTSRYELAHASTESDIFRTVKRMCLSCQAAEPAHWSLKGEIAMTPIPERIMFSVSLDIFSLERVFWQGQMFDSLVVCVDRLTGWVIAKPALGRGLTGERTAHLLMDGG